VCVLEVLGYEMMKSKRGSARNFHSKTRQPSVVTFHEPHGKDPIRDGTLREYIRKLQITREQFLEILDGCS
jgi:predicted RNA binding protein YcfA (HicA-like mRNA interferase family)